METSRRVGILTGGGDCPGLNAVIRGAVHRLVRKHEIEVWGIEDAFNGLMQEPCHARPLLLSDVSQILTRGGTILGTTNRGDPFAFPVPGPNGIRLEDRSEALVRGMRALHLEGLICIGGDGTLAIAHRLMEEKNVPVIGVPKTIDNDVAGTDYTFGFWTAVQTATQAIDMLHSTAESHDRIMVVELMGRDAGHLALAAGLAGGADVILIPEIPYRIEAIAAKIRTRQRCGQHFSMVVVAEGAFPLDGAVETEDLPDEQVKGRLVKLGGIGRAVARALSEQTGLESRVTVLGHLQRGGTPGAYDRILATTFGVKAADAVAAQRWGTCLALDTPRVVERRLADWVGQPALVAAQSDWLEAARGIGVCLGDICVPTY